MQSYFPASFWWTQRYTKYVVQIKSLRMLGALSYWAWHSNTVQNSNLWEGQSYQMENGEKNEFIGLPNYSAPLILLIVWWEWNEESAFKPQKPRRQMGCHKDVDFPKRLILPLSLLMHLFAILYTAIAISSNMEYWNTYWNSSCLKTEDWTKVVTVKLRTRTTSSTFKIEKSCKSSQLHISVVCLHTHLSTGLIRVTTESTLHDDLPKEGLIARNGQLLTECNGVRPRRKWWRLHIRQFWG